jgi:hypothetical protein
MDTSSEFLRQTSFRFIQSFDRINHAIRQLDDRQVWHRPSAESNSVGIILQHLEGNLRQWICSALGGDEYLRVRTAEFAAESRVPKEQLLSNFSRLGNRVQEIVAAISSASLLDRKRIQGFDETVMSALYNAACHLELHAGQILFITKLLLGRNYKEYWKPETREQGLP